MIRRLLPLAIASATLTAALALPVGAAAPVRSDGSASQWKSPQEVWEKTCSRCHLSGVGPELRGRGLPQDYISAVVRNGMLAMPAFPHSAIDDATLQGVARLVSTSKQPTPANQR